VVIKLEVKIFSQNLDGTNIGSNLNELEKKIQEYIKNKVVVSVSQSIKPKYNKTGIYIIVTMITDNPKP